MIAFSRIMAIAAAHIGTSGWSYPHWRGVFYPETLPTAKWFEHYAGQFDTVEINATFYRLMPESTFALWRDKAPKGFLYAVKMWRQITHRKYLAEVKSDVSEFLKRAAVLGEHLGPILIQLPPNLPCDPERLDAFLGLLSREFEYAVEFRHASWFSDRVYELLRTHQAAFCIFHHVRMDCPRERTAPLVYLRFHGASGRYSGKYSAEQLEGWAKFGSDCLRDHRRLFAFFNNDYKGYAVENAQQLRALLLSRSDGQP
ncbi:MAG: DUF72 domain-containing protein [Candidatus Sumerlaeia bacterium]|nr:DUF72 domain-containing protein [Candidatus Sumerlaeia bacterium]